MFSKYTNKAKPVFPKKIDGLNIKAILFYIVKECDETKMVARTDSH